MATGRQPEGGGRTGSAVQGEAGAEPGGPVVVAVDAMGGDAAPAAPVAGAVRAAREGLARVILVGPRTVLERELARQGGPAAGVELAEASQVIGPEEKPVQAIQRKRDSSLAVGLRLVKEGRARALVSAGNTGALAAGGLFILGRLPGVRRPAIGGIFPTVDAVGCLMLDMGAHMDAAPGDLLQYAVMGSLYAEKVLGVPRPRVGLLNVGTEEGKGNELTRRAYPLLAESGLNFVGNVEGRDLFFRRADVLVCDGFVGNVLLKTLEGLGLGMFGLLRRELAAGPRERVGAWLAGQALRRFARAVDYRSYGGAPILGVNGACVKCHGSSDAVAIRNGVEVAVRLVRAGVLAAIAERLGGGREAGGRGGGAVGGDETAAGEAAARAAGAAGGEEAQRAGTCG